MGPRGERMGSGEGSTMRNSIVLYRSPNIVRVIKWVGHLARMKEGRSVFKILTGKPIGKKPLGSHMRRWKYNIRMYLEEIGMNTRNWVDSAQDRNY